MGKKELQKQNKKWDLIKNRIFVGVRNQAKEQSFMEAKKIPHYSGGGLTFFCMVRQENEEDVDFVPVNEHMLRKWDCEFYEAFLQAIKNTEADSTIISMEKLLSILLKEEGIEFAVEQETVPIYVFTNSVRLLGAAGAFFSKKVGELAEKLESDLFVLPSSVHESATRFAA